MAEDRRAKLLAAYKKNTSANPNLGRTWGKGGSSDAEIKARSAVSHAGAMNRAKLAGLGSTTFAKANPPKGRGSTGKSAKGGGQRRDSKGRFA